MVSIPLNCIFGYLKLADKNNRKNKKPPEKRDKLQVSITQIFLYMTKKN